MTTRGLTLLEVVLGTALILGGGLALLLGFHYATIHASYLKEHQVAVNEAQGMVEQLSALTIDTLLGGATVTDSQGRDVDLGAALAGQTSVPFDINPLAAGDEGQLAVQIRLFPPGAAAQDLADLHVAACWVARGRQIGEQGTDCLDADGDGWVESPVMVSTRVSRRE
jgi:hypothetical protein